MVNYIVVSPVRDEEKLIGHTLKSMATQTIKPAQWIIVNDGSTDRTAEIVKEYLTDHSWIKLIERTDRGSRQPGKGIIEAFYEGLEASDIADWEFVVKLDCDLSFDNNYFEEVFKRFHLNPKLGIASGKTYVPSLKNPQKLNIEPCPDTHTRGPSKVYKRDCFEAMDGILKARGWDTLDDIQAMVKGYEVKSFKELVIIHHRAIGTIARKKNWKKFSKQHGQDYYRIGYHPLFMFFKTFRVFMSHKPYLLFGMNMAFHYYRSLILGKEIVTEKTVMKKLREVQLKRLKLKR